MSNDNKSKINKMEKLRQILDNPSDPEIKKSISKDDKNLETIRRKLSGESSIGIDYVPSPKSVPKKSDSLKPRVIVHKKEEKIAKPKEVAKEIEPKKIVGEETPLLDRKDKMVVFQELEKDKMMVFQEIEIVDEIQMYRPITIIEMWAFTLTLGIVAVSGLFLMRDWLFLNFGVYTDKFIPTPEGTQNVHIWFGFAFAVLGLFHLAIHIFSKKKDILPKQTLRDFKAFLHSGMYLLGLARREDHGTSGRFYGRQRIIYLALVYILGLTTLTGLLYYMNFLSNSLAIVHVIPAGLSIIVLLFHFLISIRKHDTIALNCAFITGKLPPWYVRKNHPIWYKKMIIERESTLNRLPRSVTVRTNKTLMGRGSDLTNAMFKFALLLNDYPDKEDIKAITEKLQATLHPEKLERIIELAGELKDESEEESKQKTKEGSQQNEEESTESEEPSDEH